MMRAFGRHRPAGPSPGPRGCRFWALPLTFSVVLPLIGGTGHAADASSTIDPDVRRSVQQGDAPVIVALRIRGGFQPEGRLAGVAAVAAQRHTISEAQASVTDRLGGTDFVEIRRYRSVPFLVLRVGPQALAALETMSDVVVHVRREVTVSPSAEPRNPSGPPGRSE